jgi:hypothetical protein
VTKMIAVILLTALLFTSPHGLPLGISDSYWVAIGKNSIGDERARTVIYGLAGVFYVRESPEDVAAKFGAEFPFTNPDGSPLWINGSYWVAVGPSDIGDPRAPTVIYTLARPFYVREAPEDVLAQFGADKSNGCAELPSAGSGCPSR